MFWLKVRAYIICIIYKICVEISLDVFLSYLCRESEWLMMSLLLFLCILGINKSEGKIREGSINNYKVTRPEKSNKVRHYPGIILADPIRRVACAALCVSSLACALCLACGLVFSWSWIMASLHWPLQALFTYSSLCLSLVLDDNLVSLC